MEIQIQTKNIVLNPHAERYIHKKFASIRRRLRDAGDAKLEVTRTDYRSTRERVRALMTLDAGGQTLRGEGRGVNLFEAVDGVSDVVDRQISRRKGKRLARRAPRDRRVASAAAAEEMAAAVQGQDAIS